MNAQEAVKTLNEAVAAYQNDDAINYEKALVAIGEDRAAYWASVKYHDAVTWAMVYCANVNDLDAATDDVPYFKRDQMAAYLSRLVPLNEAARVELTRMIERWTDG